MKTTIICTECKKKWREELEFAINCPFCHSELICPVGKIKVEL